MAKKSKATFQKMEKEKARYQRQIDKEARRVQAKELKDSSLPKTGNEDPDIAGIKPGPQPLANK